MKSSGRGSRRNTAIRFLIWKDMAEQYVLYCIFIVFLKYVYFVFVSPDFYTTSAESPMPVRWQPLWSFSYSE